jgi:hypothetical protein
VTLANFTLTSGAVGCGGIRALELGEARAVAERGVRYMIRTQYGDVVARVSVCERLFQSCNLVPESAFNLHWAAEWQEAGM